MKLIGFISFTLIFHLVICENVKNGTKKSSTEDVVKPQALVNLSNLKNNTKDAALRIFKLFKSTRDEANDHHYHQFNKDIGWNIFGLQKPPKCICASEQQSSTFSPVTPTVSTSNSVSNFYLPQKPSTPGFVSRQFPKFETIYPKVNNDLIDKPILYQYPPLELNSLQSFDDSIDPLFKK